MSRRGIPKTPNYKPSYRHMGSVPRGFGAFSLH
jgi:hypothetical protein